MLNHTSQYSELTDAQYLSIGKTVVEWANVEFLLGLILARLLGTPEFLARTFTDPLSAVRLQEAISEAVSINRVRYNSRLIDENILDEIEKANNEVTALRSFRNKVSHFCWARSNDEEMFGTSFSGGVPTEKSEKRNHKVVTLVEINAIHSKTYALVENLMSIAKSIPEVKEESLLTIRSRGDGVPPRP